MSNPLILTNINGLGDKLSYQNEETSTPRKTQYHEENEENQKEKISIKKKGVPGKNKRKEKPPIFTININDLRNDLSDHNEETKDSSGILEVNEEINEEVQELKLFSEKKEITGENKGKEIKKERLVDKGDIKIKTEFKMQINEIIKNNPYNDIKINSKTYKKKS